MMVVVLPHCRRIDRVRFYSVQQLTAGAAARGKNGHGLSANQATKASFDSGPRDGREGHEMVVVVDLSKDDNDPLSKEDHHVAVF